MRWFKHMSESGDDPDIDDAITLFGTDAYYVFFRTLEVMSREFSHVKPGKNSFSVPFFRKKFRLSWRKTVTCLEFFHQKKRIMFEISEDGKLGRIELICPKLKELADEHTRKVIKSYEQKIRSESGASQALEAEAEAEAEAEYLKKHFFDNEFLKSDVLKNGSKRKIQELINQVSDELKTAGIFKNVNQFIGKMRKKQISDRAILHSLVRAMIRKKFEKTAWNYCAKIIQVENGNYNERENQKTKN